MRTNKFLIGTLVVLLICFAVQTVYLLSLKRQQYVSNYEGLPDMAARVLSFPRKLFEKGWDYPYGGVVPFSHKSRDPFIEMERIQAVMNKMFHDTITGLKRHSGLSSKESDSFFNPNLDIQDTGENYVVKVDIPGMDKSKINVEIKGNQLIVSGKREGKTEEKTNKGSRLFYKKERNFGYFSRLMLLPSDVQNKSVTADYKRGVLTIIIPKKESNNPVETGTRINVL